MIIDSIEVTPPSDFVGRQDVLVTPLESTLFRLSWIPDSKHSHKSSMEFYALCKSALVHPWVSNIQGFRNQDCTVSDSTESYSALYFLKLPNPPTVSLPQQLSTFQIVYERPWSVCFYSRFTKAGAEMYIVIDYWLVWGIFVVEIRFLLVSDVPKR